MPRLLAVFCLVPALAGAAESPGACTAYGPAQKTGVTHAPLVELSGLAASRRHPGIWWAHNDSGNAFALYAIRPDGTIVATVPLRGGDASDPEDIAVGPCRAGAAASCIYLGDIGDNWSRRTRVQVFRVPEPERLDGTPRVAEALPFRYADGPHDAEALMVEPSAGRVFVVTKVFGSLGDVYRVDGLGKPGGGLAARVGSLPVPPSFDLLASGADLHPAGDRMLIRSYRRVWELRRPGAHSVEELLAATPVAVPDGPQPQAEAVAYRADGLGYLLGSEGDGSPLYEVRCAEPASTR